MGPEYDPNARDMALEPGISPSLATLDGESIKIPMPLNTDSPNYKKVTIGTRTMKNHSGMRKALSGQSSR